MAQTMTRGPDWPRIQRRWIAGEKTYSISKSIGGNPTAQGITKRAKREGWERAEKGDPECYLVPPDDWSDTLADGYSYTAERAREILLALADGMPLAVAAPLNGIRVETLAGWRKASPELQAACDDATAWDARKHIRHVSKASERGDMKATAMRLRANRLTRTEYGGGYGDTASGPTVQVVLQVPEPGQPMRDITPPSPVIEGES